jgi:hypothetical protein
MDGSVERILKNKYTEKDIEYIKSIDIYDLYKNLRREYTEDEAYDILKRVFDIVKKPYNTCKTTGKPIIYIKKKNKFKEEGRIDTGGASVTNKDILETTYTCPHCGREFDFEGDMDAMYFVRGWLTFDDIEKPLNSKYPIEIRGGYEINKRVLYFILNREMDKLYTRFLVAMHKYKLIPTNVENFRIVIHLYSNESGRINGIGSDFEVILGSYSYGEVKYYE